MGIKKTLASIVLAGAVIFGSGDKAKADVIYQDDFNQQQSNTVLNYGNWTTMYSNPTPKYWKVFQGSDFVWNLINLPGKFASFSDPLELVNTFPEESNYLRFTPPQDNTSGILDFDYLMQVNGKLFLYVNDNLIQSFSENDK